MRKRGRLVHKIGKVALAVIVATLLTGMTPARTRTYTMQSSSMKPAIAPGDAVHVELGARCCRRGSIIVYDPRRAWGVDGVAADVKRVIALPGETVRECRPGRVCIDGRVLRERYVVAPPKQTFYRGLPAGCAASSPPDECTVPEGSYFIMGDNR